MNTVITLKELLIQILGNYTINLNADGIAQIDFVWISSFILLSLGFYSLFRFIGGLFNARNIF